MDFCCFAFIENVFAMICYELCLFFLLDNIFDLHTRKDQVLEVVPVGWWFYFQKQFLLKNE